MVELNVSRVAALPGTAARATRVRGFTFLEILVVMGMLAVIVGLSVGFLGGVGKKAIALQAASILSESGNRCLNLSAGGKRATLDVRQTVVEGEPRLVVTTSVLKTILTASFSNPPKDQPGLEWFVNAAGSLEFASPSGNVSIDPDGHSGGAAKIQGQGSIDFGTRAGFAMTDGVHADVWVKPDGSRGGARVLSCEADGQKLWTLELARGGAGSDGFAVVFNLWLVDSKQAEGTAAFRESFATRPCVKTIGARIEASFDGREPSIKVDGVERYVPDRRAPRTARDRETTRRFAMPRSGVARIVCSDPASPFSGLVDNLTVAGVFRTDEDVRVLPLDVTVVGRALPWRVPFLNGRLDPMDPSTRASDAVIWLAGPGDADSGGLYEIRFGRYGSIPPPRRILAPGGLPPGASPTTPTPPPPATTPGMDG